MANLPLPKSILNFRDVGATINSLPSTSRLKPSFLYRSARPDTASANHALLTTHYHIRSIIDLRSATEHANTAEAQSDTASVPLAVPHSSPHPPPSRATIPTHAISLNGPSFERHLVFQLSYLSLLKLLAFLALGYRNTAIALLGREVMTPRGLVGLGIDTLSHSGAELSQIFHVLADGSNYPLLVHCTQGKDRTGLVVLLALLLCHVDRRAINADYVRSEVELEPELESRLREIGKVGLDESFATCPADFVEKVVAHIEERYGGVEMYLQGVGVGEDVQQKVRRNLMENPI